MAETKKLYRSKKDRVIAGVCGGLGDYLGTDSNIVRVIFVVLAIAAGLGAVIYLIMVLIVPEEGGKSVMEDITSTQNKK